MADLDIGLVNIDTDADRLTLQYLGAAALVNWNELPQPVRILLFESVSKIGGLNPTTGLEQGLTILPKRHGKTHAPRS